MQRNAEVGLFTKPSLLNIEGKDTIMNPEMFREYDIRGIAGKDMTENDVMLALILNKNPYLWMDTI